MKIDSGLEPRASDGRGVLFESNSPSYFCKTAIKTQTNSTKVFKDYWFKKGKQTVDLSSDLRKKWNCSELLHSCAANVNAND